MHRLLLLFALTAAVRSEEQKSPRLRWTDDDGLEVTIIKPIKPENCAMKSQWGDELEQFFKLSDAEGNEIGSNFGGEPYVFTLGAGQVISGMERAMTEMCVGEKRKVVIPPHLGFGTEGREHDKIDAGQTLYYTVQLVQLRRPDGGAAWTSAEGVRIQVTGPVPAEACERAAPGDELHQHYELRLADGTFVDSSHARGRPFVFRLERGEVIRGMDVAMSGMCEGERRRVVIPAAVGYGADGRPPAIPPNAELHFQIELSKLVKKDEL